MKQYNSENEGRKSSLNQENETIYTVKMNHLRINVSLEVLVQRERGQFIQARESKLGQIKTEK